MGKTEVRVIHVPRAVTVSLLVLVSLAMCGGIYYLSGRAYAKRAVTDAVERIVESPRPLTNVRVIAALLPLFADAATFLPWGFLFFASVDTPSRSRSRSYALTFLCALGFAAALALWQATLLPTRVTTFADALPNALGALCGAAFAHLRKRVRLKFQ
ncbi:MAG: hypothetical protein ABI837_07585 [Acidobacteriota bacterium]